MSKFGVISRGVKLPIIKNGDDIVSIVCDTLLNAAEEENVQFENGDIICITESVVARSEGNYVSVDNISQEIDNTFGKKEIIGVLWPIYSRNRFSMILKGIARSAKKVVVQLHHGKDEVGNDIDNKFTGVNIIDFYRDVIENEGAEAVILQSNNVEDIARITNNIIVSTIHTRNKDYDAIQNFIKNKKCNVQYKVICLTDICNKRNSDYGYSNYGLLGSNKATEETLKLFPTGITSAKVVLDVQHILQEKTGKSIEVMIYGDGCFKDPVCGIWEFADPTTTMAATPKLQGSPNEVKLKYLIDTCSNDEEVISKIKTKEKNLVGDMIAEGTTPRRYIDLLASLADLCSGSGDRGTPVVWISGWWKNFCD